MAVRKLKPVTPGQRHKVIGTFEDITASVPEKSLVYGKRSTGGRNALLFCSTLMVKNVTLLLLMDCRWVLRCSPVLRQHLR